MAQIIVQNFHTLAPKCKTHFSGRFCVAVATGHLVCLGVKEQRSRRISSPYLINPPHLSQNSQPPLLKNWCHCATLLVALPGGKYCIPCRTTEHHAYICVCLYIATYLCLDISAYIETYFNTVKWNGYGHFVKKCSTKITQLTTPFAEEHLLSHASPGLHRAVSNAGSPAAVSLQKGQCSRSIMCCCDGSQRNPLLIIEGCFYAFVFK